MASRKQLGTEAEQQACDYLLAQGMALLDRNWHCRYGELDLIMNDKNTIVFVEVRFRSSSQYGNAADSVTLTKQRKLIQAAELFLAEHPHYAEHPCRFDVVAMTKQNAETHYRWFQNAFEGE